MSKFNLPLDPEEYKEQLSTEAFTELVSLNAKFIEVKSEIKSLNTQKGILSRRIGEAKKLNTTDSDAIAQIKSVSSEIKSRNSGLSEIKRLAQAIVESEPAEKMALLLPGHFLSPDHVKSEKLDFSVVLVTDKHKTLWNQFVDGFKSACIYHRYEFREIIRTAFGHNTLYLATINSENAIVGVLPAVQINSRIFGNYIVSIPMFNYAGPVACSEAIETALVDRLRDIAKELGSSHIELRDTQPRQALLQKTAKYSLVLRLPQKKEDLWSDLGAKVRSQINRADEHNLEFRAGGAELLNDFYTVFSRNMRDLGTPVYAKSFFSTILAQSALDSTIVVVYHNGRAVSCAYLLSYKNAVEIPWASTLRSANVLNANMYMYWRILSLCIDRGAQYFDFGRSSKDAGTFKFKRQWGAEPIPLYWHYWLESGGDLPELNPNNPKYQLAISIWKRLPVWLTRLIGPSLVKNLP